MGKRYSGQKEQDLKARKEGPDKIKFNEKDMRNVFPLTTTQEDAFSSYYQEQNIAMLGSAGTGKTFIAMYLGLRDVFLKHYSRMIIVRSATPSKDIGYLPGELDEKLAVYEDPYKDICDALLPNCRNNYDNLKRRGYINFTSSSFLRGQTFDNAVIVIDEIQNLTMPEIHAIMTRTGENSRVIICGDIAQSDLKRQHQAPWNKLVRALEMISSFDVIYFHREDIVRSDLVKEWIIATEDLEIATS